jgi:hypothetical protein
MDEDTRHASTDGHADERVQMLLVAVDAAVREEADEVERVAAAGAAIHGVLRGLVLEQLAVADALVDSRQVLIDDAAGPHVGVADLGVAHLSGRQADGLPRRDELRAGVAFEERVVVRLPGERDGVVFPRLADAPAVENDKDERSRRRHRASCRIAERPA